MKQPKPHAHHRPSGDVTALCDQVDRAHEGLRRIEGLALLIETASCSLEEIPKGSLSSTARIIVEESEQIGLSLNKLWNALLLKPRKSPAQQRKRRGPQ